jgi:hypothetical protein
VDEVIVSTQDGELPRKQNVCKEAGKDGQGTAEGETQFQELGQSNYHYLLSS